MKTEIAQIVGVPSPNYYRDPDFGGQWAICDQRSCKYDQSNKTTLSQTQLVRRVVKLIPRGPMSSKLPYPVEDMPGPPCMYTTNTTALCVCVVSQQPVVLFLVKTVYACP